MSTTTVRHRPARHPVRRPPRRRAPLIAAAVVAVLALGGLAALVASGSGGTSDAVRVGMVDFGFRPATVRVTAGEAELHIVNEGKVPHDLVVAGPGKGIPEIHAGAEMDLDLGELPAGTYEIYCSVPGHAAAGMVGELQVVPPAD